MTSNIAFEIAHAPTKEVDVYKKSYYHKCFGSLSGIQMATHHASSLCLLCMHLSSYLPERKVVRVAPRENSFPYAITVRTALLHESSACQEFRLTTSFLFVLQVDLWSKWRHRLPPDWLPPKTQTVGTTWPMESVRFPRNQSSPRYKKVGESSLIFFSLSFAIRHYSPFQWRSALTLRVYQIRNSERLV